MGHRRAGGCTWTLWVTAAGFLLSIALVAALRLPGAGRPAQADRPEGLLRGTREGLVHIASEHLRGRAVGVVASTEYAAGPVGYLLAGPLVEAFGVRPAFLVLAVVLLAVALSALRLRSLRAFDEHPVAEAVG